jgi:UDP-N-acetylmuramoyl-tripeptide--D-alanyl-D-alanine ligase
MSGLTLNELQRATGGRWLHVELRPEQRGDARLGRVAIDSREVRPCDVFWALRGVQRDGLDFVDDAFLRGAAGAVVSSDRLLPPLGRWALAVDDAQSALTSVARYQRERFAGSVIAVTGSVGKTTTRQMIHAVLALRFDGAASPRNFNNHLGVPLSMLSWSGEEDYAVLELGASRKGEIASLAELCRPRMGVITRIGEAHLGGFGSRRAVAEAKAELLAGLESDELAVLNGDDPELRRFGRQTRAKVVWVGRGADCDVTATDIQSSRGRLGLTIDGRRLCVPVWGRHHVTSVLSAVAVGQEWGLTWDEIAGALGAFDPPPMRCQVLTLGGARVIDDSYSSSPTAMRAALELLRDFDAPGRRIVVCGDMRELGPGAVRLHREMGDEVVTRCGADVLVACGDHAGDVVAGARAAGMPRGQSIACRDPLDVVPFVRRTLTDGDVLLVKGSRAMALERVVHELQGNARRRAA